MKILGHGDRYIDVSVELGDLGLKAHHTPDRDFVEVSLKGQTGSTSQVGAPALPILSSLLELPGAGDLRVEVLEQRSVRQAVGTVMPAQPQKTRCHRDAPDFAMDTRLYDQGLFPLEAVSLSKSMKVRGVPCARLNVQPVQYDAATQELVVTKSLRLRIHVQSDATRQAPSHHRRNASLDQYMLTLPKTRGVELAPKPNQTMLVILGKESYRKSIKKFARWKERRGLNVVIKTTEEIGGNTVEAIQKAAQEHYDDSKIDLAYLLLVGDKDIKSPTVKIVNRHQMDHDGVGEADYRYSLLDGEDLVGDISVGRFSVVNDAQLATMVEKVLYYEQKMGQEGDDSDLSWIETAIGIASSEKATGPSDTQRMQKIVESFKSAGYSQLNEFYQAAYPKPSTILEAINEGRGFISYMGHGNGSAWRFKSGFSFPNTLVDKVRAEKKWPIIMDCACTNGDFWNRDPAFAESWQRGGSTSEPYGALGIISSTIIAAWDPPAVMNEEMFSRVLNEPSMTLGGMLTSGLLKMAETFPGSGTMQLTMDTFALFGDPSLVIRAYVPSPVVVSQYSHKERSDTLVVKVKRKDGDKGEVAAHPALVSLSLDGELVVSAETDSEGRASLKIPDSVDAKDLDLVVTGSRLVTYEGSADLSAPQEEDKGQDDKSDGDKEDSKDKSKEDEKDESSDSKGKDDEDKSGDDESSEKESGKKKKKKKTKKGGCAVDSEPSNGLAGALLLGLLGWVRRRDRR